MSSFLCPWTNLRVSLLHAFRSSDLGVKVTISRRLGRLTRANALAELKNFGYDALDKDEKEKLVADMLECAKKYRFNFSEYFIFGLKDKSDAERREFVSDNDRHIVTSKINRWYNAYHYDVKSETAKVFGEYYGRETVEARFPRDAHKLVAFLKKHNSAIVKPLTGTLGAEISILRVAEGQDAQQVVDDYIAKAGKRVKKAFIEEVIEQDERMAKFHPKSLNTLRMTTIRFDDRTIVFHPTFRTGAGDAIVDNAGAGGILSAVDAATGEILAAGNKAGQLYERHPDTNEQLVGAKLPEWDKAVELAKKLAQVIPSNRYTGWDLALSTKGWVLVEANCRGQWGAQLMVRKGFRKEVEAFLKDLGLDYDKLVAKL